MGKDLRVEYPTLLSTSCIDEYGVFEYSPPAAGWTGQIKDRRLVGSYKSLEEAQEAYPTAIMLWHFSRKQARFTETD